MINFPLIIITLITIVCVTVGLIKVAKYGVQLEKKEEKLNKEEIEVLNDLKNSEK